MLTQRVQRIKPSATMEITAIAADMRAQGIDVISLSAGEPDFDTPENIKQAAIQALAEGFTKYTNVGGTDELKDAICLKLKRDNGVDYGRKEILVSCGAKHSLYNISQVLFEKGDEVIIPAPCWVSYPDQVELAEARPIIVETGEADGFKLTPDLLRQLVTPRTKALILNTPCNPTGAVYGRQELEAIAELALEKGFYIISDEIYEKIVYGGAVHHCIASLDKRLKPITLLVNGVSKAYSMTGWRIGYAAGPAPLIAAMGKIQGQSTSNPTSISQKASIEALTGPQEAVSAMVVEFEKRRNYVVQRLNAMEGISCYNPQGAFYVFPRVSRFYGFTFNGQPISCSTDLSAYLLKEAWVAVVPGAAFEAEEFIRLSYATSMEKLAAAMDRMEEALGKLRG
ncbi:MAG: pyridoxal phosphate-dependent aminotransferase [Nitrospinae bacterium]|nr:pyridoxal phosphate-dependent aminotransferase [Nitrospinota bacterium]